jgi:hypothetical protein
MRTFGGSNVRFIQLELGVEAWSTTHFHITLRQQDSWQITALER